MIKLEDVHFIAARLDFGNDNDNDNVNSNDHSIKDDGNDNNVI